MAKLRCLFAALFCLVTALAWAQPGPSPGNITTPQATDFVPLYGRGTTGPLFGTVGGLPIGGVNVSGPVLPGYVPVATSPTAASWSNTFPALMNFNAGVAMTIPSGLTPAFTISQNLTGNGGATNWGSWTVASDNVNGAFLVDFNRTHKFGGPAANGSRVIDFEYLIQTAATGCTTICNYIGNESLVQTNTGDGGTGSGGNPYQGAYFGQNPVVRCQGTFIFECAVAEDDNMIAAGATMKFNFGRAIVNFSLAQAGLGSHPLDAALVFYTGNQVAAGGGGGPWGGNNATASAAAVGAAGSGYTNGTQTLTLAGVACATLPQVSVTVSGNAIASVNSISNAGSCFSTPAGAVATTGGGGTGGTLTITWAGTPSVGFHNVISLAELGNGTQPIDSAGCIICAHLETLTTFYAATGIDLSAFTFSGNAFRSPAGSATVPSYAVGNSTTGFYSVSTTGLGFSINGTDKLDYGITNSNAWTFAATVSMGGNAFFGTAVTAATLAMTAAAPTVSSGQIGYGGTTAATANCGSLMSAIACIVVNIAGTAHYVPYY